MRFLSPYAAYAVQVQRQIDEAYATGMTHTIQRSLIARFAIGGLTPGERELAIASFTFNGFYQEQDEVTVIPPDYRIALFDSRLSQLAEGWSDEEREQVENTLLLKAQAFPGELCLVPEIQIPAPWPRYDEFGGSVLELVSRILEDGYELEGVLAYELDHQNRSEVVNALSQLIADAEPERVEEVVG